MSQRDTGLRRIASLVLVRRGNQRGDSTEKGDGGEHDLGLAGDPRPAQLIRDLTRAGEPEAAVSERRAGAISLYRSP